MNDCLWYGMCVCDGCENGRCDKYLSMNSDEGDQIQEQYKKDVEEALKPVRAKYRAMYF